MRKRYYSFASASVLDLVLAAPAPQFGNRPKTAGTASSRAKCWTTPTSTTETQWFT